MSVWRCLCRKCVENKKGPGECQDKSRKVLQVVEGGVVQAEALRGQGCTNRARSESEISVSSSLAAYCTLTKADGAVAHIDAGAVNVEQVALGIQ